MNSSLLHPYLKLVLLTVVPETMKTHLEGPVCPQGLHWRRREDADNPGQCWDGLWVSSEVNSPTCGEAGAGKEGFLEEANQAVFPSLALPLLGPLHLLSHQTSTETWKAPRIGDLGLLSTTFRDSESECLGWGHGELYFEKLPG